MIQLPPDFTEFLTLLHSGKVNYLLIGGYAVSYYGYPRATGDMDIWLSSESDNISQVIQVIKKFGFDVPTLNEALFADSKKIIRMGVPPLRLELMTHIDGVEFAECYKARHHVFIQDIPVDLISLEHLKANKRAAGRHKDLNDLENLP